MPSEHNPNPHHPDRRDDDAARDDGTQSFMTELWDWVKSIGTALVIVFVLHTFVFNLSTVKGSSMQPTLEDGEWLFVNKWVYWVGEPKRGDVVILKDPSGGFGKREYLVKRIVALPGDTVEVKNHELYVNGEKYNEPYIDVQFEDADFSSLTVEKGHYFVIGDNRHAGASRDSRSFGSVPDEMIKGRADFILWPLKKIKKL
jgi:signal peptidase I